LSDAARPPRAVLDTDVIYSRVLHELIGRLAYQERLLTLIWSDELLNEAERILVTRKQVPKQTAKRWVAYMRQAFPDQRVAIEHLPADLDLATLTTDAGDHHICALAVAGHADLVHYSGSRPSGPISRGQASSAANNAMQAAGLARPLFRRSGTGAYHAYVRDPLRPRSDLCDQRA
jgi:predicted nucleic acid-binding protein